MSITLRDVSGAWITCACDSMDPRCLEAFALGDREMRALDGQPHPRGDWSGNPETFHRPHSHIGGDLPPFHPWLNFSIVERARRWAMGDRPENHVEAYAQVRDEESSHFVGAFFYDPDLAKFGNAFSPFVDMPYQEAMLAMQRPFEDRYNPRYESQNYFSQMATLPPVQPVVVDEVSHAYDYLVSLFADYPEIASTIIISHAGARSPDGSYVDTRTPGRGLVSEEESRRQPAMNAVSFGVETRAEANRLRAMVGDEVLGVPIVYSVREEWRKQMPRIGRPLRDDEFPGLG